MVTAKNYAASTSTIMELEKTEFDDFHEFEKFLKQLSEEKNAIYSKRDSRTIQAANKRLQNGNSTRFDEKFRYSYITYRCKHFGEGTSSSEGFRPNQRSYKIGCKSFIYANVDRQKGKLVITKYDLEHNHETSKDLYKHYPERRRTTQEESNTICTLSNLGVPPASVCKHFHELNGRCLTVQDIRNIRKAGSSSDDLESIINVLEDFVSENSGNVVVLQTKPSGEIGGIFFQTAEQRKTLEKFPEIIHVDGTYRVNNLKFPLYVALVEDGYGKGVAVGYALLCKESKECIKFFLSSLQNKNDVTKKETKCFMIDKDFTEIAVISELYPNAEIHLCVFHVLKAIRQEINKLHLSEDSEKKIKECIQGAVYASREEDFTKHVKALEELSPPRFFTYFNNNWVNCQKMWANCHTKNCLDLRTLTNNRLERHNQELKKLLSSQMTVSDCIKAILQKHDEHCARKEHVDFVMSVCQTYNVNDNNRVIQWIRSVATPYAAKLTVDQFIKAQKLNSSATLNVTDDHTYSVCLDENESTVEIGEAAVCSCSFWCSLHLPCRHIFVVMLQKEIPVAESWISGRWQKTYQLKWPTSSSTPSVESCVTVEESLSRHMVKLSRTEKFNKMKKLMLQIASHCSEISHDEFVERYDQLLTIDSAWMKGDRISVSVDIEESVALSSKTSNGSSGNQFAEKQDSYAWRESGCIQKKRFEINEMLGMEDKMGLNEDGSQMDINRQTGSNHKKITEALGNNVMTHDTGKGSKDNNSNHKIIENEEDTSLNDKACFSCNASTQIVGNKECTLESAEKDSNIKGNAYRMKGAKQTHNCVTHSSKGTAACSCKTHDGSPSIHPPEEKCNIETQNENVYIQDKIFTTEKSVDLENKMGEDENCYCHNGQLGDLKKNSVGNGLPSKAVMYDSDKGSNNSSTQHKINEVDMSWKENSTCNLNGSKMISDQIADSADVDCKLDNDTARDGEENTFEKTSVKETHKRKTCSTLNELSDGLFLPQIKKVKGRPKGSSLSVIGLQYKKKGASVRLKKGTRTEATKIKQNVDLNLQTPLKGKMEKQDNGRREQNGKVGDGVEKPLVQSSETKEKFIEKEQEVVNSIRLKEGKKVQTITNSAAIDKLEGTLLNPDLNRGWENGKRVYEQLDEAQTSQIRRSRDGLQKKPKKEVKDIDRDETKAKLGNVVQHKIEQHFKQKVLDKKAFEEGTEESMMSEKQQGDHIERFTNKAKYVSDGKWLKGGDRDVKKSSTQKQTKKIPSTSFALIGGKMYNTNLKDGYEEKLKAKVLVFRDQKTLTKLMKFLGSLELTVPKTVSSCFQFLQFNQKPPPSSIIFEGTQNEIGLDIVIDNLLDLISPLLNGYSQGRGTDLFQLLISTILIAASNDLDQTSIEHMFMQLPPHLIETPMQSSNDIKRGKMKVGNTTLSDTDFATLRSGKWLNDQVIHAYLGLLMMEHPGKVYALPSFLGVLWEKGQHSRWLYAKIAFESFRWVLMPIHTSHHWSLLVVDFLNLTVGVLNSICNRKTETVFVNHWNHYWKQRSSILKLKNHHDCDHFSPINYPCGQQYDGDSCGVFVLMNAEAIVTSTNPGIMRQHHTSSYRQYVRDRLLKNCNANKDIMCDLPFCQKPSGVIRWVSCDICNRWCHFVCCNISAVDRKKSFKCVLCAC